MAYPPAIQSPDGSRPHTGRILAIFDVRHYQARRATPERRNKAVVTLGRRALTSGVLRGKDDLRHEPGEHTRRGGSHSGSGNDWRYALTTFDPLRQTPVPGNAQEVYLVLRLAVATDRRHLRGRAIRRPRGHIRIPAPLVGRWPDPQIEHPAALPLVVRR